MRIADRDHELADAELRGIPELGRREVVRVRPEPGQIGERIRADDAGRDLPPVHERGRHPRRAFDDVRRGDDEAVPADHDPAAAAPLAAQVGDRGRQAFVDRDHGPGVRVERVVLVDDELQCHATDGSAPVMVAVVPEVEVTRDGAVLTITLNRPGVLNALTRAVHDGIHAGLEAAKDPSVRAVVITGAGRGFCVGQDLQEFSSGAGSILDNLRSNYHRNVVAIRALEKPVIAAVNGPAAGAGMSLAFACDVRIASDAASFVPAFVNIGLVPDSGGTWLVRRVLGTARAFEWLATGRRLQAEAARPWG